MRLKAGQYVETPRGVIGRIINVGKNDIIIHNLKLNKPEKWFNLSIRPLYIQEGDRVVFTYADGSIITTHTLDTIRYSGGTYLFRFNSERGQDTFSGEELEEYIDKFTE